MLFYIAAEACEGLFLITVFFYYCGERKLLVTIRIERTLVRKKKNLPTPTEEKTAHQRQSTPDPL